MTSLFSRLQKLNKEATPAPWKVTPGEDGVNRRIAAGTRQVGVPYLEDDAALIVECRNSLPAVLNLIEAVKESRWWATEWASTGSPYAREQMAEANVKVDEAVAVFVSGQED